VLFFLPRRFFVSDAQALAAAQDLAVERGAAARSGQKRMLLGVDMDKQTGRFEQDDREGADDLLAHLDGQTGARLYENPALTAPVLRHPGDIRRAGDGDGGGARDWGKLPGRVADGGAAAAEEDARLLGQEELLGGKEELILEPTRDTDSR
jgi:hypothetical protein